MLKQPLPPTAPALPTRRVSSQPYRLRTTLIAYAFLAPALLLLLTFTFYPMVFGTLLAFTRYNVISPMEWVGLDNFRTLANDRSYHRALINSLRYLLVVPLIQLAALLLALLVNRKLPGIALFRAAYYVPVITSFVVAGIMWNWMYSQFGLINWALGSLGLQNRPFDWLNHRYLAFYAVMFVTFWKGIGYYMVLYLAGLQNIPSELAEAARIDGANRAQVLWHITLPLLRPTMLLCVLLSTLAAVKVFEEVYVMTGGGPFGSTTTALLYVYNKAFQDFRFGLAAAASLVISVASLLLSFINFRYFAKGGLQAW